jgi:hypothetical protein
MTVFPSALTAMDEPSAGAAATASAAVWTPPTNQSLPLQVKSLEHTAQLQSGQKQQSAIERSICVAFAPSEYAACLFRSVLASFLCLHACASMN